MSWSGAAPLRRTSRTWSSIGEEWLYFLLGSVVEGMLLLGIARVAWTWPHASDALEATQSAMPGTLAS